MTAAQRTSLAGLVRGLAVIVGLSLIFGTIAALLAPGASPGGWDAQTVAQRILAKNPGGCPTPAASYSVPPQDSEPVRGPESAGSAPERDPASAGPARGEPAPGSTPPVLRDLREKTPPPPSDNPPFDGPLRARIVNQGEPCQTLFGAAFESVTFDGTTDYQVPIGDSGAVLQVQLDAPLAARASWKFPAFLITFIGSLLTGLVALSLVSRPALAYARRGQLQPPHARNTFADYYPPEPLGRVPVEQPAGRPMPAWEQKPPPLPRVASSGLKKGTRSVALPALTTSGLSGLTVDRGTSGHFDVYAATQVGLQHAAHGQTREDAYAVGNASESGWVFMAVADGLGSARNSHTAAQIAVRSAIAQMHQRLPGSDPAQAAGQWREIAEGTVGSVLSALNAQSADDLAAHLNFVPDRPYGDLKRAAPACTLAFAALGPVREDGYTLLWGCVGDSDVLLVDRQSGRVSWLTDTPTKRGGGLVSNITHALPRDADQLRVDVINASPSVMTILASDGMADAIRQETAQFAQLLPQVAQRRPAEWQFGEIVGFELPGLHDDRTLIAAWPRLTPAPDRS